MAEIGFHTVSKRFGSVEAVKELNLHVLDHDFLVLLGPSGCGKTTALRMLAGLETPTSGRISLGGRDITEASPADRDLAMVFQSYALYPHMSVFDNIAYSLKIHRTPRKDIAGRVASVGEMLQIGELLKRRPRELSGGQRQRVALGRAIVRHPQAFLMDEPLSNLDAKLRTTTRAEISRLHRELDATVVYVTHDQVEAMTMATRIAIMSGGSLQQVDSPEAVYDRPANTFVAEFIGTPPMNLFSARMRSLAGVIAAHGPGLDVPLGRGGEQPAREIVLGVRPEHLRPATVLDALGEQPRFEASVDAVEMLGNEVVVLVRVGDVPCRVRGPRNLGLLAGRTVTLTADTEHLHVFDPSSGTRLEWRDSPAERASAPLTASETVRVRQPAEVPTAI